MNFLTHRLRVITLAGKVNVFRTCLRHLRACPSSNFEKFNLKDSKPSSHDITQSYSTIKEENEKFGKSKFCAQEIMPSSAEVKEKETRLTHDLISKVNCQISENNHGRLFAVVRIYGKQYKITTEDIIVLQCHFIPKLGESVRLNKVLLVGASDFTVIGRPVLSTDLVKVEATVMEKTLSQLVTTYRFRRRTHWRNHTIKLQRIPYTMLRINNIEFTGLLNETPQEDSVDKLLNA